MFDRQKVYADVVAVSTIWRTRPKLKIILQISGFMILIAISSVADKDINGLRFAARLMAASSKSEQLIQPSNCTPWGTVLLERHQTDPCVPPRAFL